MILDTTLLSKSLTTNQGLFVGIIVLKIDLIQKYLFEYLLSWKGRFGLLNFRYLEILLFHEAYKAENHQYFGRNDVVL